MGFLAEIFMKEALRYIEEAEEYLNRENPNVRMVRFKLAQSKGRIRELSKFIQVKLENDVPTTRLTSN